MADLKELKQNGAFCMLPWIHMYTTPGGTGGPCCIAHPNINAGNSRTDSLIQMVNSPNMNQLRLDMLNGVKNPMCATCHSHEEHNIRSFRDSVNFEYGRHFDEAMAATNEDGTLKEFKMRYFDIRFNNICNFKCRTCNQDYSSQWEMENKRMKVYFPPVYKNDSKTFLNEVLSHIPTIEVAYFAGGEPLITEEHYVMLEEMIRTGRTDISLRYNSNISNLKYKDKDLLQLWKHFDKKVQISASIDHFGKRAEYIRHGTDWGKVESNFKLLQTIDNIDLQLNTVLSVYNFLTLDIFYQYLIDNNMYVPKQYNTFSIYKMDSPSWLSSFMLPEKHKQLGLNRIEKLAQTMKVMGFTPHCISEVRSIIPWAQSKNTWEEQKALFKKETIRIDELRDEKFVQTFPELADLLFI